MLIEGVPVITWDDGVTEGLVKPVGKESGLVLLGCTKPVRIESRATVTLISPYLILSVSCCFMVERQPMSECVFVCVCVRVFTCLGGVGSRYACEGVYKGRSSANYSEQWWKCSPYTVKTGVYIYTQKGVERTL